MSDADERSRILIVDDEESVLVFVERVLRDVGYYTSIAGNAEAALTRAQDERPFDLLITDLMMPGMAGDELARRLRHQQPDVKVLYFTGFTDQLFSSRPVLWANEAFLEKPVTATGLREAVSLALFGHTRGPNA